MRRLTLPWLAAEAAVALLLLLFGVFLNLRSAKHLHDDYSWANHTQEVIGSLDVLLAKTNEALANQRGYVITAKNSYLAASTNAVNDSFAELDKLQAQTRDNSLQQGRLVLLRQQLQNRYREMQVVIDLRKTQGLGAAVDRISAGRGEVQMDSIRHTAGDMFSTERSLLEARSLRSEATYRNSRFSGIIWGLASLGAVSALLVLLGIYSNARSRNSALVAEQAERLRTTLECIGDAVIVTDEAGRITNLNPVAENLTGWLTAEAAGLPLESVFVIINEATREAVESPALRALREGTVVGLANHTILVSKDGNEHPIDDSAAPVKDRSGKVVGVVLVFRDVTERRASEKSRAVLASIVEDSDDAIVSKTLDGIITSWNSGAQRIFGYTADEAIGQPIQLLIPPELWDEERSILNRLKRGERIDHFETTRISKDGMRIEVSLTVSPLRDHTGRIIGASKVARDITARKQAETDSLFLANASESLSGILDYERALETVARLAVPKFADWCAIDMVDEAGNPARVAVAHVNPEKVALAGDLQRRFPADKDAPTGFWNIIRTGKSEMISDITDEMIDASVPDKELLNVIKDLGLKSYMGVPIEVRGKVLGVIVFIGAESGRRYTERDLTVAEDLAHRAAAAVENTRLYAELREEDSRKDRFLATLAHELRNPLAPMLYSLEIAKKPGTDPELIPRAHEVIERQLTQLVRLVDDLLDVSRITQDKLELRVARIELASVVRQALETVRPLAESKSISTTVTLPENQVYLHADPTRIAQVFTNLLNNACKFTNTGGHVHFSAHEDGSEIVVRVKDDGIGMSPAQLPRVFEMFAQLDESFEGTKGGLGIGLSLVKRLVEMHGGSISVESEGLGMGTEFLVRLPLATNSPAPTSNLEPGCGENDQKTAESRTLRVLIVDDNKDAAEMLQTLVKLAGHATRVAHDGASAVAEAESMRPDIVLLDIGLPIMSGYEVARAIRKQEWGAKVLLAAVTGWGQDQDRQKSTDAGFDFHLVKPIGQSELIKLFAEADSKATASGR